MWQSRMTGDQCVMQVTKLAWVPTDMRAGHSAIHIKYCSCPLPRIIHRAPIYQVSHSYKARITVARSSYHWQPVPPNPRSIPSCFGKYTYICFSPCPCGYSASATLGEAKKCRSRHLRLQNRPDHVNGACSRSSSCCR